MAVVKHLLYRQQLGFSFPTLSVIEKQVFITKIPHSSLNEAKYFTGVTSEFEKQVFNKKKTWCQSYKFLISSSAK